MLVTRDDLLHRRCSYDQYYGQFVSEQMIAYVKKIVQNNASRTHIINWEPHVQKMIKMLAIEFRDVGDHQTLKGLLNIAKSAEQASLL